MDCPRDADNRSEEPLCPRARRVMKREVFDVRSRMLALLVVAGATAAAPAVADVTSVDVTPLTGGRSGVVVDWRAASGTATVALRSGRMLAVHSIRRVTPGTRVRVDGIKWGTPASGIKWSVAPQGIKWGIKRSRNGTYTSNLRTIGRSQGTPVSGVVVRRFGRAVAIGTPGGIVVVRMAVWLPKSGAKISKARALPVFGDTITTNVRIGPGGRLHGDGVRIIRTRGPRAIPVSGRLSAKDGVSRTIRITNVADRSFPVHATLTIPSTIDMARLEVGREVVASASIAVDETVRVDQVAPNETFAAGNDPAAILVAPPPADGETLTLVRRALDRWTAGRAQGEITDQSVYDVGLTQLGRADAAARDGNHPVARAELDAFLATVTAGMPDRVAPMVVADVLALASAALDRLR